MPKQLIDAVNDILIRVDNLDTDNRLSTLTDSARQNAIDVAVQVVNEEITQLYNLTTMDFPTEQAQDSITLVADDRDYALASDLVLLRYPLKDEENGSLIYEYPGGFSQLNEAQIQPQNFTGLPTLAAIRPTDGELYLDMIPKSEEAGRVFKYWYDKELLISTATDTFPFNNSVYTAMVPWWVYQWRMARQNAGDNPGRGINNAMATRSLGLAASLLKRVQNNTSWTPRKFTTNPTDPFESPRCG